MGKKEHKKTKKNEKVIFEKKIKISTSLVWIILLILI